MAACNLGFVHKFQYLRRLPTDRLFRYTSTLNFSGSLKPFNDVPGPKPLIPSIGNLKEVMQMGRGVPGEQFILTKLTRKYGDVFKLKIFNEHLVVINDVEYIRRMFANEGKLPSRSALEQAYRFVGKENNIPIGMIMAYGEDWRRLRLATNKQVIPQKLRRFIQPLDNIADDLCGHIEEKLNSEGWLEDLRQPLRMWTVQSGAKVIFNEEVNTFSNKDIRAEKLMDIVSGYTKAMRNLNKSGFQVFKKYSIKLCKQFVEVASSSRNSLTKELFSDHYEKLRADIEAGTVDEDTAVGLLDQWLIEGKLKEDEALAQALDVTIAGVDTTSNTATFMLHELAKNPDVQEAVYREIMEVLGPHGTPSAVHLQKLSLVRGCVKETLRVHPIIALLSRKITTDIEIRGYQVPAGATLVINYFPLSVDPRYFNNPLEFNPDRWSRDRDDTHPFASLPFGFGPRMCYGRRIAELELHLLLTRVLQRFKLSTDQEVLAQSWRNIIQINEPVKIKFTKHTCI